MGSTHREGPTITILVNRFARMAGLAKARTILRGDITRKMHPMRATEPRTCHRSLHSQHCQSPQITRARTQLVVRHIPVHGQEGSWTKAVEDNVRGGHISRHVTCADASSAHIETKNT